ncbi:2-C-methyl-D-erythritol 2,4-cyclodiphosphate synthase [Spirochaetota bacterium]
MYRSGLGFDTHVLKKGRKLILGGVEIPNKKGLLGHSDADVLLHAIMDSLLGAAGKGDIGKHFPDTDNTYMGIASTKLLEQVYTMISGDFEIMNIDAVVICQEPKLAPFINEMKKHITGILKTDAVNIKATTTEKMNAEGKRKCISAQSMCMLKKKMKS